jgi:hypothetical protein
MLAVIERQTTQIDRVHGQAGKQAGKIQTTHRQAGHRQEGHTGPQGMKAERGGNRQLEHSSRKDAEQAGLRKIGHTGGRQGLGRRDTQANKRHCQARHNIRQDTLVDRSRR